MSDSPSSTATEPLTSPLPRRTPTGRRAAGELRRQVAQHLHTTPGAHTAGEIARVLECSSGAARSALETLAKQGHARQMGSHPVRYQSTETTAKAATSFSARSEATEAAGEEPPTATSSPTPITRPNGEIYRPRALADLPDVEVLRRLRAAQIPALLYGPPGTGKTSLVEAAHSDLITVAGDGDTTVADFVGEYTQAEGGGYEFVYGPLVKAMLEGRCLFIDDATLISPKVLAVVYPAMDGRRQISVKAHTGETITAADGFYVIAGHNPGVHGAVLTEALSSRFSAQIHVSTDYDLAHALKINSRVVKCARNLAKRHASGEIGWAPQLRELIAFQRIVTVLGTEAAVSNLLGIAPEEDRDVVAEVLSAVYGRTITPLALGSQL